MPGWPNATIWSESTGRPSGSNPFTIPGDGDRDQVIDAYRDHYLPHMAEDALQMDLFAELADHTSPTHLPRVLFTDEAGGTAFRCGTGAATS